MYVERRNAPPDEGARPVVFSNDILGLIESRGFAVFFSLCPLIRGREETSQV
jgi:hypothetical protein